MSFALGSLIGGAAQGFSEQQQKAIQQALAQQQNTGAGIAGSALFGGAPQAQPQGQGFLSGLLAKLGQGGAQPTVQQPQGGAPPSPMGGGLMPSVGGAPGASQPQPQGGAPMPSPQPQLAPQPQQGAFQGGQLTLEQVVQRINQVKPNATSQEKMAALSQILPIMNAQSQAQYRQIMAQIAPPKFEETKRHNDVEEKLAGRRADETAKRDEENAGYKRDALKLRADEFKQRMDEKKTEFEATLKEKYDALEATNDRSQAVQLATDVRAAIKERFAATRSEISAANSFDPDQKKALMDKAAADRDAATARLDAALAAQKAHAASSVVKPNADGSRRTERAPSSTKPAAETAPAQDTTQVIQQAKDAIAQRAPRDKVLQKLKEMGIAAPGI